MDLSLINITKVYTMKGLLLLCLSVLLWMKCTCTGARLNMFKYEESRGNTVMQQVAVNPDNGEVYIGAQNMIYHLDHNLKLIKYEMTGPAVDGSWCSPLESNCDGAVRTDNHVSVMEIYPDAPYLFFCGTIKQGICSMLRLTNINDVQELSLTNVVNYIGNTQSVQAFFGQAGTLTGGSVTALYTAIAFDNRPQEYVQKAVSSRKIQQGLDGQFNISYVLEHPSTNMYTAIDFDPEYKEDYIVDYVYGFEHEGFSYFVTVQKSDVQGTEYVTRLVRVCQNDPAFYSYTEITLNCKKSEYLTTFYNIAIATHLGSVGEDLANKFNWDLDEKVLYIVFGKSNAFTTDIDASYGTGLCMYPLSQLRRDFTKAQKDCYSGWGTILPWIDHTQPRCNYSATWLAEIDNDFCGTVTHVGIGGRYPLLATANFTRDDMVATALSVFVYHTKTIAVMGTVDGKIVKVLLDGHNSAPYAHIDVGEGTNPPAVARDMAFDLTQQHLYVLTGNRVTKVQIQSCSVYTECSQCVTTRIDPLNCGWCGDHCSTRDACLTATWAENSCPPVVYDFHPRAGPLKGGTRITIEGENFGTSDPTVEVSTAVTVALVDCVIESQNKSLIVCATGEAQRELEREIRVVVVDRTQQTVPYNIEGYFTTDHDTYFYKNTSMFGFRPAKGPQSGGTSLTIAGHNLNIGSQLEISLGHLPCIPISVEIDQIICNTTRWVPELDFHHYRRRRSVMAETVNVTIDKASLFVNDRVFTYEEDPIILDVHPRASIKSGGILITVTGTNLNVVASPRILGTVIGESRIYEASCAPSDDGTIMLCDSPNINYTSKDMSPESPLVVDIHFLMDGVQELRDFPTTQPELSRFKYEVDPIFHAFPGDEHVRTFYEDESHLDIKGEFLDLIDLHNDLLVIVGSGYCNVTLIGTTVLLCAPEKPNELHGDEPLRKVEIHLGNLQFHIGSLQYAKRAPNVIVAGLMGSGLLVICLLILCFVVYWMKKTHRGFFRKKHQHEYSVRYTSGSQEYTMDNRDAIYRLNPITENPYSPQNGQLRHRPVAAMMHPAQRNLLDDESRRLIDDANLLIDQDHLTLCEVIGQGHFGCVYRGYLIMDNQKGELEVAVKTLKSLTEHMYTSSLDGQKFLDEALRMQEFDHPNILRLIGITLDKDEMPLVVLPFMRHGDLLSYIRDETNNPTVKDLMDFGIQIAEGMAYLSNLKFVHRDLAARNCMLDDCMNVKVADFGLSRDIYERDYYSSDDRKAKLPVKWMALESLEKGIYNIKTDVWSYGVVLWELMTRGVCPYPEVDNWDIIKFLKSGRRMPQPGYCPNALYSIMLHCWNGEPRLRPPFTELVTGVKKVIVSMELAHAKVGIAASYVNVPTTQNYLYPQPTVTASPTTPSTQLPPDIEIAQDYNTRENMENNNYTGSRSTLV